MNAPSTTTSPAPVIAEGLFSFQIGGSERVGADLAREFRTRGYRPICFAFYDSDGPIRQELRSQGIECIDLNYIRRNRLVRRGTYQWVFYRFLRQFQVHALHVHHATALTLCGIAAKIARLKSVVMTEHALHQLQERPSYRQQAIRDCRFANDITAVHAGIADYFRDELQVPAERLHVISNAVRVTGRDEQTRARLRAALAIPQHCFAFLFAGRFELVKDLGTLLRAFALIPEPLRSRVHLLLAGDGSQRPALEKTAANLRIAAQLHFLGARTDVRDLMSAADAFVMSSITEGLPLALIEAMASDLPCIATSVGGIPGLFTDAAGILVPPASPEQLCLAMCGLIENPTEQRLLIQNARRKVERLYDLDQVVTRYLTLLRLPSHWPPKAK
jgi:glycosyltransferase involved in cell wall biosynthesis